MKDIALYATLEFKNDASVNSYLFNRPNLRFRFAALVRVDKIELAKAGVGHKLMDDIMFSCQDIFFDQHLNPKKAVDGHTSLYKYYFFKRSKDALVFFTDLNLNFVLQKVPQLTD